MVLELAIIEIIPGENQGFETAIGLAKNVISQSKGFISIEVKKCIEVDNKYILLIYWETLEDHTIGFRESDLFVQWRGHIGKFFHNPPLVQHFL
jgi:heme-degrading monooxygenase HmoA